jgi:hypothetical protein
VIGACCSTTDFALTEDINFGEPVCEDFLEYPGEGAIAWVGPTSDTWAEGNSIIAEYFVEDLVSSPGTPIAEVWLSTVQRMMADLDGASDILKVLDSYIFLGDPMSALRGSPSGPPTASMVEERPEGLVLVLAGTPSHGSATIRFSVPAEGPVKLTVYNVQGRRVNTLLDEVVSAGSHVVNWDAAAATGELVSSGVYLVRLETRTKSLTRKMVLLR